MKYINNRMQTGELIVKCKRTIVTLSRKVIVFIIGTVFAIVVGDFGDELAANLYQDLLNGRAQVERNDTCKFDQNHSDFRS